MMIDPMLSLAFTVHANPGVYALLLGSGISRASGIPTGWEIVLDLVRKLAILRREECVPDEETWYRNAFEAEPNYSVLLNELARTPTERKQLLYPYFQPTPEDREQGRKVPTSAHRAIAELVSLGYFRVILTTNFDTLMEDALREAGVTPYVVRHSSDIAGAPPLSHVGCVVVKLHGDYLDTRIRNTPAELEKYEGSQNKLLDRVVDEFGLIVCGWSAEWDAALRDAVARCKSRRYMTYWASFGPPRPDAQNLIDQRSGQVINITGADQFFRELADKITALRDVDRAHPLAAAVAAATVKRFLEEPRNPIRLNDLVLQETERVRNELSLNRFPGDTFDPTSADLARRYTEQHRSAVDVLLSVMAHGCYWGTHQDVGLWPRCLSRVGNIPVSVTASPSWRRQRLLPAALLLYVGGIAAMANEQDETTFALLTASCADEYRNVKPAAVLLTYFYLQNDVRWYPGVPQEEMLLPLSAYLHATLREPLMPLMPEEELYEKYFNKFEYLLCLAHIDMRQKASVVTSPNYPVGRFAFGSRSGPTYEPGEGQVALEAEATRLGGDWLLLHAGLFGGQIERYEQAKRLLQEAVQRLRPWNMR